MRVRYLIAAGLAMFAFLVTGAYVTAEFRSDSVDVMPAGLTSQQQDALLFELHSKASACLDHPLVKAFVLKTTLQEFKLLGMNESSPVRKYSGDRTDRPSNLALSRRSISNAYEATLNKYTLFAIPVGTIRVSDDVIYC